MASIDPYSDRYPEKGISVPIDEFIKRLEAEELRSGVSVPKKDLSPRASSGRVVKPIDSSSLTELSSGDDFYLYSSRGEDPVKVGKFYVGNSGQKYVRLSPYGRNFIYFKESSSGYMSEIDIDSHSLKIKRDVDGNRVTLTPQQKAYRDGYIARGRDEYLLWKRSGKRGNDRTLFSRF